MIKLKFAWKSGFAQSQENVCLLSMQWFTKGSLDIKTVLIGEKLVPSWEFNNPWTNGLIYKLHPQFWANISAKKHSLHEFLRKSQEYLLEVWRAQHTATFKNSTIPNQEPVQSFVRTGLLAGCNCKKNKSALFFHT